jgi:hypothetical protein
MDDLTDADDLSDLAKRASKWDIIRKLGKLIAKYGKKAWDYIYCVGFNSMLRCGDEVWKWCEAEFRMIMLTDADSTLSAPRRAPPHGRLSVSVATFASAQRPRSVQGNREGRRPVSVRLHALVLGCGLVGT